ncbi:HNH endonuclease [Leeia sp.]|uniref:HNH endonuclease n=1 Tax=Leeia sp. TaxID=2884678 RepID=UPI0035B354F3
MRKNGFSASVLREIAQSAMYICANPSCLCFTGYPTTKGNARSIAEGAHILPAGKKGPRADAIVDNPAINLSSAENGIWLCNICHKKIDDDPVKYSVDTLFDWKERHKEVIRGLVGLDLEAAIGSLKNERRYHQEVQEFVSFLEGRRVLYEGLDQEFPPRVLDSLNLIRERLTQTRARVNSDTELFCTLTKLQNIINEFLRSIGKDTDLSTLICDSGDPVWRKFADELKNLRLVIRIIVQELARNANYNLHWL